MDPFQILTEELWEKVLKHLKEPKDKLNVIGINGELENAFQRKKVEWGFAAVLLVLFKWGNTKLQLRQTKEGEGLRLRKLFLDCRLVSTSCFHATEKYVELYCYYSRILPPHPRISSRGSLCRLFDKMKDHPKEGRCPIISRRLQMSYSGAVEVASIMPTPEQITGLLERIGRNLMSFEIHTRRFPDLNTCRVFLQTLLGLLPNLKNLRFRTFENTDLVPAWQEHELEPLILPNFPPLTKLDLLSQAFDFAPLYWFRPCYPHLETLYINLLLWDPDYNIGATGGFPNLQRLLLYVLFDIMLDEIIRALYKFFMNLDTPKINHVNVLMATNEPYEVAEKNMHFVEKLGLTILSKRYPDIKWTSKSGEIKRFSNAATNLKIQIYDLSTIKPVPIKKTVTPAPHQQQRGGGMCSIV